MLTCWPDTALRGRHVKEVGDEESMLVGLLALKTNTRTSSAIRTVHVVRVDSKAHGPRNFVYAVQALHLGLLSTLVTT